MKYNANGMLTRKSDSNGTTNYYYDSSNNLIGLSKGNNTLLFYYDSNDEVTSFKYNGEMYYYIKNLQGDIVKIIDQSGAETASYKYDSWGKITAESGSSVIRELNPFRYRSYVYDTETGLYYLQSRYYDPITGRFLNADVYCDTQTGSPLSTNMFAYCENNAVMRYDVTGKDAWWLQSPNSAFFEGHTSLLIQEKPGYWWYFYWGPSSIQLLFLGTTTQKDINKKVKNILKKYNSEYRLNIKYEENYTKSIRFKGDFVKTFNYVKSNMDNYSKKYSSKIYKLRFNPESNAISKPLKDSKHKYYKNKLRPQSMLIRGNKLYDLTKWNCMQVSSTALSYGKVKNVDKQYFQKNMLGMGTYVRPNVAYSFLKDFHFGIER